MFPIVTSAGILHLDGRGDARHVTYFFTVSVCVCVSWLKMGCEILCFFAYFSVFPTWTIARRLARLVAGRCEIRPTQVDTVGDKLCYFTTDLNRFGSALF